MTKQEAVILSAYTGYLLVPDFSDVHEFIEKILERPVWTHQLADPAIHEEIKKKCKPLLPTVKEEAPANIVTEDEIARMPTVDAVPVTHGHWILEKEPDGKPYCFHCSVCDVDFRRIDIVSGYAYCPYCGARMDQEVDYGDR